MRRLLYLFVALALLLAPGCTSNNLSPLPPRVPGVPAACRPTEQRDARGAFSDEQKDAAPRQRY